MPDIVLTTFNARYAHASFGLRYLHANLGELRERAQIIEFDLDDRCLDVAEAILACNPRIVALAVYVWNARQTLELARVLKQLRPDVTLILGGPEISYETELQPIAAFADHIVCGEGDMAFPELCRTLIAGEVAPRILLPEPPALDHVVMPYDLYTDVDLAHRTVYVESSRGCPFGCEFCLSSLDIPVRRFPLELFLQQMQRLLDRGCQVFKFVDRTFNIDITHATAILDFFFARYRDGLFLHFEMIPDRLPQALIDSIARFPAGAIQLEIGIQTFDETVAQRIGRRQDNAKAEATIRLLRERTNAHIHADLVAGLPGESLESFAAGFDCLLSLRPHEIQLGILKRLHGAPIARHTQEWGMLYSPDAPYEVLQNCLINFATMQRIRRIARYWDLLANSGQFAQSLPLVWGDGSAFAGLMALSDWLFARTGQTHRIALPRLFVLMLEYLTTQRGLSPATAGVPLAADYLRPGRREIPEALKPFAATKPTDARSGAKAALPRQGRHMGA